jgi:cytochrome c biogenesis protein CcmG/thiol:disulfide interchange protein DsbE
MSEVAQNVLIQGLNPKKGKNRKFLIFALITLLNIGLLFLIGSQLLTPTSKSGADPLIGLAAPNFILPLLQPTSSEQKLSLASLQGKPIVLNFWASWCTPCKNESPLLQRTYQQLQTQGKDVVFLGVDFQDSHDTGVSFVQRYAITYPMVQDISGSVALNQYTIAALPVTLFVNRQGIVVSRVRQELTEQALLNNLHAIE